MKENQMHLINKMFNSETIRTYRIKRNKSTI